MLQRLFFILFLGLLLSACKNIVIAPEIESMKPVVGGAAFELTAPITAGMFELAPGKYVAAWANESGTIYRGPTYALRQGPLAGKWYAQDGGVWVASATSPGEPPRVVRIGGTLSEFKDRQSAIAASQPLPPTWSRQADQNVLMALPPATVGGALGGAIAVGLIGAMSDAEAKKVAGKPVFIPSCHRGVCETIKFAPQEAEMLERAARAANEVQPR